MAMKRIRKLLLSALVCTRFIQCLPTDALEQSMEKEKTIEI